VKVCTDIGRMVLMESSVVLIVLPLLQQMELMLRRWSRLNFPWALL